MSGPRAGGAARHTVARVGSLRTGLRTLTPHLLGLARSCLGTLALAGPARAALERYRGRLDAERSPSPCGTGR